MYLYFTHAKSVDVKVFLLRLVDFHVMAYYETFMSTAACTIFSEVEEKTGK